MYLYALYPSKFCLDSCKEKKNMSVLLQHIVYLGIILLLSQPQDCLQRELWNNNFYLMIQTLTLI